MIGHQFPICVDFFSFFFLLIVFVLGILFRIITSYYVIIVHYCFSKTFLIKYEKE